LRELLAQVGQVVLAGLEHQWYPFDLLVEQVAGQRSANRHPLFDVIVQVAESGGALAAMRTQSFQLTPWQRIPDTSKFDLSFDFGIEGDAIAGSIEYDSDLYAPERIERMAGHLLQLAEALVETPDLPLRRIDIITPGERQRMAGLYQRSHLVVPGQPATVKELFEQAARQYGPSVAVAYADQRITYRELNERANYVARALASEYGLTPDEIVVVALKKSDALIAIILGILKAGGAYLPIPADVAAGRMRTMLEDSAARLIITDRDIAPAAGGGRLIRPEALRGAAPDNPARHPAPASLAYVLYTSGSTGTPKGVMVENGALCAKLHVDRELYGFNASTRMLLMANLTFDVSVQEIFLSLAAGGTLVVPDDEDILDPERTLRHIRTHGITDLYFTPSYFHFLTSHVPGWKASFEPSVKSILFGGESLTPHLLQKAGECTSARVDNQYGPTEGVIYATYYSGIRSFERNLIGWPLPGVDILILDGELRPVPEGIFGNLYIGSDSLARGYLNDPALTAEKFIRLPELTDKRLYFTGDVARFTSDGLIEFKGRQDAQVKIRGVRVELTEIRNKLLHCPDVENAEVVYADEPGGTGKKLVAYVQLRDRAGLKHLRSQLREELPAYMFPDRFVELSAWPLTPQGKLDVRSLSDRVAAPDGSTPAGEPVATPVERQLRQLWEEVLKAEALGPEDNFFESGGNSLMAIQLVAQVRQTFRAAISIKNVFQFPTIRTMAAYLADKAASGQDDAAIPLAPGPHYPASPAQLGIWLAEQLGHVPHQAYVLLDVYRLQGPLAEDLFRQAIALVVQRHEVLRTLFRWEDNKLLQTPVPFEAFAVPVWEKVGTARQHVAALIRQEAAEPLDLSTGLPIRFRLLAAGEQDHFIVMKLHHAVADARAVDLILGELLQQYTALRKGLAPDLSPLRIQYKDYAAWLDARIAGGELDNARKYWLEKLSKPYLEAAIAPNYLPAEPGRREARRVSKTLRGNLKAAIDAVCRQHQCTPFVFLLATLKALLHRITGGTDIMLSTVVSGRLHPQLLNQVGNYLNQVMLRSECRPDLPFGAYLDLVNNVVQDAFSHAEYPFDRLVQENAFATEAGRFNHPSYSFNMQQPGLPPEVVPAELTVRAVRSHAKQLRRRIIFNALVVNHRMVLFINFDSSLYTPQLMEEVLEKWHLLIGQVVANPDLTIQELHLEPDDAPGPGETNHVLVDIRFDA
jgi:amino acid adenylation domain-containing protein